MCDLTLLAFDLADRYRTPVVIMTDGFIGQMMEPVEFPCTLAAPREKPWAVRGTAATRANLITSIYMTPEDLERHVNCLEAKYTPARAGQLVEDVRLVIAGRRPVRFYSRVGGMVPTPDELLQQIIQAHEADHVRQGAGEAEEFLWGV